MAARGGAGGADRGDVLPRRHVLTDVDEDATRAVVRVAGGDAATVVDLDEVAVGPEPTCIDHRAGMCRVDGAAAGRPDVGAPVVRVRAGGAVRPGAEDVGDGAVGGLRPARGHGARGAARATA